MPGEIGTQRKIGRLAEEESFDSLHRATSRGAKVAQDGDPYRVVGSLRDDP